MLLSIIVPVYNVEAYLERCVNSLLRQGLKEDDYEIILVDDGSNDSSPSICRHFCSQYGNIRYISQRNQGVGVARNTGIRESRGKYLCFVDADDYLIDYKLSSIIQHCDGKNEIIRYWCKIIHPNTKDESVLSDGRVYYKGGGHEYIKKWGIETFCWNCLYKRDFLINKGLFFESICGEDFYFMADVLLSNPTIISVASRIYNYEIHDFSLSTTLSVNHNRRWCCDLLLTMDHITQKITPYKDTDIELYENCMKSLEGKMLTLFSHLLYADYSMKEYKRFV